MKMVLLSICSLSLLLYCCRYQEVNTDTSAQHLYHQSIGEGSPIMVIHGGPGLGSAYIEKHIEALSEKHQLIILDQANSGRSPLTLDTTKISLAAFVHDIEQIRRTYNLEQFTLMAHSWGGLLAVQYANQFPERVKAIILMNSLTMDSEANNQSNTKLANQFTADDIQARTQIMRSEAFQNQDVSAYEELMLIGFNYQFFDRRKLKDLDLQLPPDFGAKSKMLGHLFKDLAEYDFSTELSRIKSPILLLYGLKDPLSPIAINYFQKFSPGAELRVVEDAGHFPFIEKPDETISMINDFMNEIE